MRDLLIYAVLPPDTAWLDKATSSDDWLYRFDTADEQEDRK